MIGAVVDDLREPQAERRVEVPAVAVLDDVRSASSSPASSSVHAAPLVVIAERSSASVTSASSSSIGAGCSRKNERYQPSLLTRCRNVSRIEPYVPGAGVRSCSGVRSAQASMRRSVAQMWCANGVAEERGRHRAPAFVATSPMILARSSGRDHIGQWLVGRSIQVMLRSSGMPARNAMSGFPFA